MSSHLSSVLQDIASAIKYKLEDDTPIAPIDFPQKIDEIPVDHGGYADPTPIIEGTVKLVSNSASFIRAYAFYDCSKLTAVTFPECTTINSGVFADCYNLKATNFEKCEEIGSSAFANCSALQTIEFPSCLKINSSAFVNAGVSGISSTVFPVCSFIGQGAFQSCRSLIEANFPEVLTVDNSAFYSCYNLSSISFPKAKIISQYAFQDCRNLTSIDLPNVVSALNFAWWGCYKLSSISLPECVSLGAGAFWSCSALTGTLELPKVKELRESTFLGTSLSEIRVPECLTIGNSRSQGGNNVFNSGLISIYAPKCKGIGRQAFQYCSNVTSLVIPYSSITYLGERAFAAGPRFSIYSFENVTGAGSYCFTNCSSLISVYLPKLETLSQGIFNSCYNLISLYAPNLTGGIPADAFAYCSNLSFLDYNPLKSSVVTSNYLLNSTAWGLIGQGAFRNCQILNNLSPFYVNAISTGAFQSCYSLDSLTFLAPSYLSFPSASSVFSNCSKLSRINIVSCSFSTWTNKPSLIFANSPIMDSTYLGYYGSIYVPSIYLSIFKSYWSDISDRITTWETNDYIFQNEYSNSTIEEIPSEKLAATFIYASAFNSCQNLTSINLPNCSIILNSVFANCKSLTDVNLSNCHCIGPAAFISCTNLINVSLPLCRNVGTSVFADCYALESINLPELVSGSPYMFLRCSNLSDVSLPNLLYTGTNMFNTCINLSQISLPEVLSINGSTFAYTKISNINFPKCKRLGGAAFGYMGSLISLDMEECLPNVSAIGAYAFQYCSNLETINFNSLCIENMSYIDDYMFVGCSKLKSIDLGSFSKLSTIYTSAFNGCTNLSQVILPSTIKWFGSSAFNGCTSLPSNIYGDLKYLDFGNGYDFLFSAVNTSALKYSIHSSCRFLQPSTFYRNNSIVSLILPSTIVAVPGSFARSCPSLQTIYLLGDPLFSRYAFEQCNNLSSVYWLTSSLKYYSSALERWIFCGGMNTSTSEGTFYVRASLLSEFTSYLMSYSSTASIVGLTDEQVDEILENL